jgi:hypothetical protein
MPMLAFADSQLDLTNVGGTLSGSASGMSLSGSSIIGGGTLNFSTGALTSGSLASGGVFAGGGSFTVAGLPGGQSFSGTFFGPVTWTMITLANGTHNYTLSGAIAFGPGVNGATVQLTINTGHGFFNGSTTVSSGDTNIVVPEPGTLGLLGTGLVGIAGVVRRKLQLA